MGYKTEGWQDIKVGDRVEVIHHPYSHLRFKDTVLEVNWRENDRVCISISASESTSGRECVGGISLTVGEDCNSQVEILRGTVDWTKAPDGATDWLSETCMWYKDVKDYMFFWNDLGWVLSGSRREVYIEENGGVSPFTSRPAAVKAQQSFEWKIKHIKSDDYKCGRDVALTILYKDTGDGYYEYKYSICNTTDMFSRKKGVEAALDKPDTWKVYIGNYKTKGALQIIVWHLPFTRKMSREVVDLLIDEGFYGS